MTEVWLVPALQTHKGVRLEQEANSTDHAVIELEAFSVITNKGKQLRAQELNLGWDEKDDLVFCLFVLYLKINDIKKINKS